VRELIGSALPHPITDFMALSATKKLPQVVPDLCQHCGNCTRCPYQAITLNEYKVPLFDAGLCIGLLALCAKVLRRRHLHASANRPGTGRAPALDSLNLIPFCAHPRPFAICHLPSALCPLPSAIGHWLLAIPSKPSSPTNVTHVTHVTMQLM